MSQFDTSATCQEAIRIREGFPNTNFSGSDLYVNSAAANTRSILNFTVPPKPSGADVFDKLSLVLVQLLEVGASARSYKVFKLAGQTWTQGSATWNTYAGVGSSWGTAGADKDVELSTRFLSNGAIGSSFAFQISALGLTWGERGSVLIQDAVEGSGGGPGKTFDDLSSGTYAWRPRIVVRFTDNPPAAINDLGVTPDTSLSEASYTYRQRAVLKWTASKEDDFKRYRIRKGINRSLAPNHTHLTFINSRASTTYLDTTLYTDGSTVYYSLYPEDRRNGSTSTALGATYVSVSNIASWTKPDATIGSVSIGSSASTLQEIEVRVRTTTMMNAKKAKIVWADGGVSYSQNLTSAGGYLYSRHRYTKATAGYTIRGLIEDIYGFRSSLDSYATTITISNLGPVARIAASPNRTKTAGTFSFGNVVAAGGNVLTPSFIWFGVLSGRDANADGVGLSYKVYTGSGNTNIVYYGILLRREGGRYRVIYSDRFTTSTTSSIIRRDINWRINKGDIVALMNTSGTFQRETPASGAQIIISSASTLSVGQSIDRWREVRIIVSPAISISYALTNPMFFTAKDSFARGSNRFINRFRWAPGYAGDFGAAYATGGSYVTGATTSFYYAWTAATTQFVAVRAVDDQHASSIDHIGVIVETEATFRIPNDLRDGITDISDNRSRGYTFQPTLGRDYGSLDVGKIGPVMLTVRGESYTQGTSLTWIDIDRISACFTQAKRVYIIPPWSTGTSVSGFMVDPPTSRSSSRPMTKQWEARIAVSN